MASIEHTFVQIYMLTEPSSDVESAPAFVIDGRIDVDPAKPRSRAMRSAASTRGDYNRATLGRDGRIELTSDVPVVPTLSVHESGNRLGVGSAVGAEIDHHRVNATRGRGAGRSRLDPDAGPAALARRGYSEKGSCVAPVATSQRYPSGSAK